MQSQTPKTNESVKTGLEISSHHIPEPGTEKDADELVHENTAELPNESAEQDMDELVHSQPATPAPDDDMEEKDPDDLVHEKDGGKI